MKEMRTKVTKAQVKQWKRNWEKINRLDLERAKVCTLDERFNSLVDLMIFAHSFPRTEYGRQEKDVERVVWQRLRSGWLEKRGIPSKNSRNS